MEDKKADDIREWQKRYCKDDMTMDQLKDVYNEWAKNGYDEMMTSEIWGCPKITADMLEEVHNSDEDKMRLRILDVGAGTGMCGIELKRRGFQHVDGLEPAENMLAKAKERNVYETYINTALADKDLEIEDGTYDAVTSSGVGGYFCSKAVRELARIVKSGGTIVFVSNHDLRPSHNVLEETLKALEIEKKIMLVKQQVSDGYMHKQRADVIVYKVL